MSRTDKNMRTRSSRKKIMKKRKNKFTFDKKGLVFFFKNYLWMIIIGLGILVVLYPFVSQQYYKYISKQEVEKFDSDKSKFVPEEINRKIALAEAYNQSLRLDKIVDPFNDKKLKEGRLEYARMLEVREMIGHIEIPRIGQKLVIKAGTSPSVLQECAGHMEGTSLPVGGKGTHAVITAHRGLPSAKLFTDLNRVRVGDVFFITNIKEKLAYKVDKIQTVEPNDFEPIKINLKNEYISLLTCTPYMINSHRLIVRGHRIPLNESKKIEEETLKDNYFRNIVFTIIAILFLILVLLVIIKFYNRKKKVKISRG
ncbi:class C sortase [Peptostreptococcus stomatis]|uniref:Sortase family protein n=1 Tax=Peptostreptococcus stomatis DSM 17678 TaxID=596315 RepID=E0E4U6_9FIRM|nr:class C sortase [Peptostreptococcus stomatis]EFM64080.1 sortase family protein [Peptostreptococcus stomatis DSM 17678]